MKYYLYLGLLILSVWFPSHSDVSCASGIMIGAAIISAAGTAYGANKNAKASKANAANQDLYLKAQQKSEAEARKLFDTLIGNYNKSKEKLEEGFSLRDYIGNQVEALNDPGLKMAYYGTKELDFAVAQKWADAATDQNISTFNKVLDDVSGGDYKKLIATRNQAILGDDINAVYSRARELRNTNIPAGSVRRGPDGEALPNSRADKFEFSIATEEVQKSNDRLFQKSTTAINDDRTAAARQQVQASSFLPFLDFSAYTTNSVTAPFNQAHLNLAMSELSNDAQLAGAALGKAVQNPLAPGMADAHAGDAMVQQGTQLAIAALGSYFSKQNSGGGYSTSGGNTPQQTYNLDQTMGSNSGVSYG